MTKTYRIGNTEFINKTSIQEIMIQGEEMKNTPGSYKMFSKLLSAEDELTSIREFEKLLGIKTIDDGVYTGSHTVYSLMSAIKRELKRISKILHKEGFDIDLQSILITKKGRGYYLKT